ncbi:MAG: hypothetical protein LLG42_15980 [Chloroflexi bacterium]|nr:hypothetical protein [Chloroflexota bacterium]
MNTHTLIRSKSLVRLTTLLVISLVAIMTISPARAFVSAQITNIAGQLFKATEDYPGDDYPDDVEVIEPRVLPLGEALSIFPYDIHLPSNIPSEYVLTGDNVRVYVGDAAGPFANTIEFAWLSNNNEGFTLRITDRDWNIIGEVIAPDSTEEILLGDNHPAALIQGGWDADNKVWNNNTGVRLRWSVDNLGYELMGTDSEQLIEIALSTFE